MSTELAERVLAAAVELPTHVMHLVDGLVELHHPVRLIRTEDLRCSECDVAYPCSTIRVMAEALGVD